MTQQTIKHVLTLTPNPAIDVMITAADWQRSQVNSGQQCQTFVGGKGINVATNLALLAVQKRHNVDLTVSGWLGQDNDHLFSSHFARHAIDDAFIRLDGETRSNFKITDPNDNDTTDINLPGLPVSETAQQQLQNEWLRRADAETLCVLAGSLPRGVDNDFYARLISQLRTNGQYVILDSSKQPLQAVLNGEHLPQVVKPNIHELREVSQQPLNDHKAIIELAKSLFNKGLEKLVVSLGSQGALFISPTASVKTTPPPVSVHSTVGAGDAMVSGLAYALLEQLDLPETARLATALSAAKIASPADGLSVAERLTHLLPLVEIE